MHPAVDTEESIRREAQVVGLREFRTPSLEAVERRRLQLWVVTAVLLVGFSGAAAILSLWSGAPLRTWLTPTAMRVSLVALALGFCAYAIEKEVHLQRLARLLVEERVLTAALSNRLHELSTLLDAGKAMNSVLELGGVLDIILGSSLELLKGHSGSILLTDGGDELRAVCVRGNDRIGDARVRLGEGVAGHVAETLEPLLITGQLRADAFRGLVRREQPVESGMCVPLIHRDELLGVLDVNAANDRTFTEYDLRALSLFAEQAATAIANARLYEAERAHVQELLDLNRVKSEFIAMVSHDLRTPLTSILGGAQVLQRMELTADIRSMTEMMESQAKRLASMVDKLLTAAKLERGAIPPVLEPVDVRALIELVVRECELSERPIEVAVPDSCYALGDEDLLREVLDNLIDNAFKYGTPPVRIEVSTAGNAVALSVLDAGPGVPVEDRERVFERFVRLPTNGDRSGMGLGLPIVRDIVSACGGTVLVKEAPGGGAAVQVRLRASAPARAAS